MTTITRCPSLLALGVLCCSIATSQTPAPTFFSRDVCVKVKEGRERDYSAYLQDVPVKLAKSSDS